MKKEEQQSVLFRGKSDALREEISQAREELDDHRLTINDHSNEIESVYELMNLMAQKLDKFQERLDELTMLVKHGKPESPTTEFKIQRLTGTEKEVFFALYILTETAPFVTYHQLARKTVTTVDHVSRVITSMISKGVPVEKKYSNGNAFLGLDKQFRQVQSKENIVKLDTKLTYWTNSPSTN